MGKSYNFLIRCLFALLIGVGPIFMYAQGADENTEKTKQTRKEKRMDFSRYGYVGLNIGAMLNHTDISNYLFAPSPKTWKLGYGVYGGWQFSPIWGIRAQFANGQLAGLRTNKDALLKAASGFDEVRFKAFLLDYHLDLTVDLNTLFAGYRDRKFNLFAIGGIGQVEWQTKSFDNISGAEWRNNGYGADNPVVTGEGTKKGLTKDRTMAYEIPVGLGVNWHFAPKWHAALETQLKFVDSDRLDTWTKGAAAVKFDMYSYTHVGVYYHFGGADPLKKMKDKCDVITYKVDPNPLEVNGGKIHIKIVGTFPEKYFQTKAAIEFTPVLKYDGGQIALKTIQLKGEQVSGEGIMIPYSGGSFTYEDDVDFIPELASCQLVVLPTAYIPKADIPANLTKDQIVSGFKYKELCEKKIADGVKNTPAMISNTERVIIAPHGYQKETIISKNATIYYEVNLYNLNWNLRLNKLDDNKQKINDLMAFIALGYKIKNISIDGWASPEGEETFNANLSENRSKSTFGYLTGRIQKLIKEKDSKLTFKDAKTDVQYDLAHHGPDWNGFLANVQNSDLKDKSMVLNVINSASTPAKKEQEIRNMIVIYPEIEEKLLPPLRRAEIVVNCYEPKKTDAEILGLSSSNPRDLDEKELLYAATLTDNQDTKYEIYKTAINLYPDSYKGYVNASSIEIAKGDLNAAKAHLEKAASLEPNNGAIFNDLGVIAAKQNDYTTAEQDFMKAQQLGEDENYNLAIINIHKGDYQKAITLFGNTSCDYNVALANLLNKNYQVAEKNLTCAPKDAQTYYLMAVLGARTDNSSMVFENLTKAVQENPDLKGKASGDLEFIKYFNDPSFKSIVQ